MVAHGDTLTIRLLAPAPDLLSRIAEPGLCAVPSDTPIDPNGVRTIPSAGPYYVASYTPGQGIVLVRNPNYRGSRPHRLRPDRAGRRDRDPAVRRRRRGRHRRLHHPDRPGRRPRLALASQLAARYGPGSPAAAHGNQQYFVNPQLELDYFVLNTHRPLFSDVRLRQAVNYAIDRRALAALGSAMRTRCPSIQPTTTCRRACPGIATRTSTR